MSTDIRKVNYEGSQFYPQTHKQAVIGLQEELNNKASITGYYESMGCGTSTNLKGNTANEQNPFTYRTSGGSDDLATGTAYIEKIEGNTVNYNQLVSQSVDVYIGEVWGSGSNSRATRANGFAIGKINVQPLHKCLVVSSLIIRRIQSVENENDGASYTDLFTNTLNTQPINKKVVTIAAQQPILHISLQMNADDTGEATQSVWDANFVNVFDLTQMFGASDADIVAALGLTDASEITTDAGVAAFEKYLENTLGKKDYYPYNAGELIPVNMTALETVGFNQWDEEWEVGAYNLSNGDKAYHSECIRSKNTYKCFPNTQYYCCIPNLSHIRVLVYDAGGNYIKYFQNVDMTNGVFTTPSNAHYFTLYCGTSYGTTYKNDICINLSWSGYKNGTYEPYWKSTLAFDPKNVYGQLEGEGELVQCLPNGMKKAGDVKDMLNLVGAEVYNKVGDVDLGEQQWYSGSVDYFGYYFDSNKIDTSKRNIITPKYIKYPNLFYWDTAPDVCIGVGSTQGRIYIKDSSLANLSSSSVATALSGVKLYFELATPLHYTNCIYRDPVSGEDIPLQNLMGYKVDDFGTERILPENTSTLTTCSPSLTIRYGVNAVDTLRRLGSNYVKATESQSFTSEEKAQARTNIGAVSFDDVRAIGSSLPTSDPETAGMLWNDNGIVKVSAGSNNE